MAARGAARLLSNFFNQRVLRTPFFSNFSEGSGCSDLEIAVSRPVTSPLLCKHWSSKAAQGTADMPATSSLSHSLPDGLSPPVTVNSANILKKVISQRSLLEKESNEQTSSLSIGKPDVLASAMPHPHLRSENVYRFEYNDELPSASDGDPTHKALLVDAAGTLLVPSQPAAKVYKVIGEKYGVTYSEQEILARYRWAYSQPWCRSRLRFVKDGRPFWQYIVEQASGCSDSRYFEELYHYYATAEAWQISDPEAEKVFKALRDAGIKLAVVSNFDTRLRPLMQDLNCCQWFHALAVSAEVEAEKPNPTIFLRACELLGVNPEEAVHVGDDRRNDIWGARDAGCDAWLWGSDVFSFREVADRIGVYVPRS